MEDEQYKRYRKMKLEPSQILFKMKDKNNNIHFLIQGTNRYKVTIHNNGFLSCSCPDMKFTPATDTIHLDNKKIKKKILCKHCLQIIDSFGYNIDHTFFKRNFFTPDELQSILKSKI